MKRKQEGSLAHPGRNNTPVIEINAADASCSIHTHPPTTTPDIHKLNSCAASGNRIKTDPDTFLPLEPLFVYLLKIQYLSIHKLAKLRIIKTFYKICAIFIVSGKLNPNPSLVSVYQVPYFCNI